MSEAKNAVKFEILALDTKSDCVVKTEDQLLHSLCANGTLWKKPSLESSQPSITDKEVVVTVNTTAKGEENSAAYNIAYELSVIGDFDRVEPFRLPLIAYLEHQRFGPLYILKDEVSQKIACQIYPLLYRAENALRGYLIKFMSTRLGPGWWEQTAEREWKKKVHQRKRNETIFAQHVDNNAYLIDFGELGKMIHSQSSGFTSMDDILKKVEECDETPQAIAGLKADLKSNYYKFFKKSFKDKGFSGEMGDAGKN